MDLLLPAVSFIIAFFCSQAGVSGAFLLLPFQISVLGFINPSVNATNFLYNVVAIPGGVYRYAREKRFLWILAIVNVLGTIPGIFIGSLIRIHFLLDVKVFKLFVGMVLLYLGVRLFYTTLNPEKKAKTLEEKFKEVGFLRGEINVKKVGLRRIEFEFWGETYCFSPVLLFAVSFMVGIVGGVYGVGGGALLTPFIIAFFKLPIYTISGATLFGTFVTSIIGVLNYSLLGYPPNLKIGLLLGIGGFFGIYAGARFQKFMPERVIRVLLSVLILMLALKYIAQYWF